MARPLPTANVGVDYEFMETRLTEFLRDFKSVDDQEEDLYGDGMDMDMDNIQPKYMTIMQQVANREKDSITIELDDIRTFDPDDPSILVNITKNAKRYVELFCKCVDSLMPAPTIENTVQDEVLDVIRAQRRQRNLINQEETQSDQNLFPPTLTRRYHLYIKPVTPAANQKKAPGLAVRDVKGAELGHLITVSGIVTRVSDVKPAVEVQAYTCDRCGTEVFQEVKRREFGPLIECPGECKTNDGKGQLFMSTRASKFNPFQDVKIQELTHQVPTGHIPRSLTVHLYGPITRSVSPGDVIDVSGIFLPVPYTGFKAVRAGLLTDTLLEAQYIEKKIKQYSAIESTAEIEAKINRLREGGDVYGKLSKSIAPEIFGHEDVKKALLLLLVGGVTKEMGDGMRIRGDINICLMGDPGVAKSQLLKYMSKVAPRGVYTTGRGSSGVGLTAAVMRDPVTDEMVLEGGALVLADNGICCIDEFDKMDDSDRTAIHEVMEQQTISISKAGITTTLNARTSILAAANPLYGRYNPKVSPVENINLPAALLSRFDILFLILDTPSVEDDERLAQHIAYVHIHEEHPPMDFEALKAEDIRNYIAAARQVRPNVPSNVAEYLVSSYADLRKQQARDEEQKKQFSHTSPRTLLAIIRMAQAVARLNFRELVEIADVDEALRLIKAAKASLNDHNGPTGRDTSRSTQIYEILRSINDASEDGEMAIDEIRRRVTARGFTEEDMWKAIQEYEELGVMITTGANTRVRFVVLDEDASDMEID